MTQFSNRLISTNVVILGFAHSICTLKYFTFRLVFSTNLIIKKKKAKIEQNLVFSLPDDFKEELVKVAKGLKNWIKNV